MALVTLQGIKNVVAEVFELQPEDLDKHTRTQYVVQARHIAMWFCRNLTKASYPDIGREFNRDHTTVIVAVRKIEHDMDANTRLQIEACVQKFEHEDRLPGERYRIAV